MHLQSVLPASDLNHACTVDHSLAISMHYIYKKKIVSVQIHGSVTTPPLAQVIKQ
jgi:hypothetical protein